MLCPKCKEYFEEGSRRFCPTDGARLVSEAAGLIGGRSDGGIFANLIPKMEGIRDLEETRSDTPRFTITGQGPTATAIEPAPVDADDGIFFELDEVQPLSVADADIAKPSEPIMKTPVIAESRPPGRKVNPQDIPAGHVDLGDAARPKGVAAEFDSFNPEHFIGRVVKGRYKVTEYLGGDESGLAYLADDRIVADRMVTVRILTGGETDEIMDSILAEERVSLSHFSHPNIARLIDSGQFTNGTNFLISEYVDALSVGDILGIHGKFPAQRAARIIRQASMALNEAHQEGILHRDVRLDNLIIESVAGETEHIKLVNFGASNGDPTQGNMAYKAHEMLDGRIATVSSDIFSLAVVAYQMLTGQLPFTGESARELVRSQNAGFQASSELGAAANEVFARAFAFNAADRYPKAREFGDAFCAALAETPSAAGRVETAPRIPVIRMEMLKPIVPAPAAATDPTTADTKSPGRIKPLVPPTAQPAWKPRLSEPTPVRSKRSILVPVLGLIGLVALAAGAYYYYSNYISRPAVTPPTANAPAGFNSNSGPPPASPGVELPAQQRVIAQPPNSTFYQNTKENLKGDLLRNFVGFTIYYPRDWKVNDPQPGATAGARGKFLDISRPTPDGGLKEQMLISYYTSRGTFAEDSVRFPELVKETNQTLQKLVPGYRMVSEREIKFNGEWRAYEVKFQFDGKSAGGEKLIVWGRRLFVPVAKAGATNGFEITMLATSAAADVRGVDDVGVRGELASILNTFEPSQN